MGSQRVLFSSRIPAALLVILLLLVLVPACGSGKAAKGAPVTLGNVFADADNLTRRVLIIPFNSGTESLKVRAQDLEKSLTQRLLSPGKISLMDFNVFSNTMKQIPASVTDPRDRMLQTSRFLGINTIISGQVTDLSANYYLSGIYGFRDNTPYLGLESEVTIIDVASGTVLGQKPFREELELSDIEAEAIKMGEAPKKTQVDKLAQSILAPISQWAVDIVSRQGWTGFVLAVEGMRVKITAGKGTGLKKGDQLSLYALGERIISGAGLPIYLPGPLVGVVKLDEIGAKTTWADLIPEKTEGDKPPQLEPGMILRAQ